eukprot:60134_1
MEKRDASLTTLAKEKRDVYFRDMDVDKNGRIAFTEYLLWSYHKTPKQLFTEPTGINQDLLDELRRAIEEYERAMAPRRAYDRKISDLERRASGPGVRAKRAQHELAQLHASERDSVTLEREVAAETRKNILERRVKRRANRESIRRESLRIEQRRSIM